MTEMKKQEQKNVKKALTLKKKTVTCILPSNSLKSHTFPTLTITSL